MSGKALADVLTCADEVINDTKPYEIFDPEHPYKRKLLVNFTAKKLLVPVFEKGSCVYEIPTVSQMRDYCAEQVNKLWSEVRRFDNPHEYYVDLSQKLWDKKNALLNEFYSKR